MAHKLAGLSKIKTHEEKESKNSPLDIRPKDDTPTQKDREEKRNTRESTKKEPKTYSKLSLTKGKVNEGASTSTSNNSQQDKSSYDEMKEDMIEIKQQLKALLPIVTEMHTAYNQYQESEESPSDDEEVEMEEEEEKEEGEITENLNHFQKISGKGKKRGPMINSTLANGTETMLTEGISTETKEELFAKYSTPENCERLEVVTCNSEIYKNANKYSRINETKLTTIQSSMMKGLSAVIYAFNKTLTLIEDGKQAKTSKLQEINTCSADAIALISNASHQLDIFRKTNFKRGFKNEMSSICKDEPIKDLLFGNETELTEKVKHIGEVQKLSYKVNKKVNTEFKKRKNPFLGRKQTYQSQRNSSYNYNPYSQKKRFNQYKYKKQRSYGKEEYKKKKPQK